MSGERIFVHPKFKKKMEDEKKWVEETFGMKINGNSLSEAMAEALDNGMFRNSVVEAFEKKANRKNKRKKRFVFEI